MKRVFAGLTLLAMVLLVAWVVMVKMRPRRAGPDSLPRWSSESGSLPEVPPVASIAALGAAGHTIQNDLRLLQEVFVQWQTNFPSTGNPIGTNAEITAALAGANPLRLDLIPRDHPAVNARGELCDRWGTPFRFHQRSGTEMQIISAGPDHDFATADDIAMP